MSYERRIRDDFNTATAAAVLAIATVVGIGAAAGQDMTKYPADAIMPFKDRWPETWPAVRPAAASSCGRSGASEAPKSTVLLFICRMPTPDPTAWYSIL